MSVDPALVEKIIETGVAGARWLWHKLHGDDVAPDEAKLREMALLGAHSQIFRLETEIERQAQLVNAKVADQRLSDATTALLDALHDTAKPSLTDQLLDGAQVTQMPAGWKPEDELEAKPDWDNIKTMTPEVDK